MSFDDLNEHDLFLPESVWGEADLHTTVNQPLLILVGAVGAGSCVLMWWGDGLGLTWIGAILFLVFMYAFTVVSNRGINRQNREINELERTSTPNQE